MTSQKRTSIVVGARIQEGANQVGCIMGPDAFRTAGLMATLAERGYDATDLGDLTPAPMGTPSHANPSLRNLPEIAAWTSALIEAAYDAAGKADLPIFLGGDHSMSIGTVPGVAAHAADQGRPLFVLWLDAHPDLHTLDTTTSGNLHGTPTGYFTDQGGFEGAYPTPPATVPAENVCFIGLRSVDPAERDRLRDQGFTAHDMRAMDEHGVAPLLRAFLQQVTATNGMLHVSLDVDFLDPSIAPAVGTTVPGGATFREAHLIMEMLHDSGIVTSLDLVELNPFLDERGRTAKLMVDLTASLLGRKVLDRPTTSY
jgi:arginase